MNCKNIDNYRLQKITDAIKELNIDPKYLTEAKKHNSEQPYHNFQHLLTVALRCIEGSEYFDLDYNSKRILVIAALLHDISHSGDGTIPDIVNVTFSAEKASDILAEDDSINHSDMDRIINLIMGTENTGAIITVDPLQGILNDADIMQSFEPDYDRWFNGLSVELKTEITLKSTISFCNNIIPETAWGKKVFKENVEILERLADG